MQSHGKWRRAYVPGTFDLYHEGHLNLTRRAREIAVEVCLSLNTDEFAERYKRRPRWPLQVRMDLAWNDPNVSFAVVNIGDEDSRPAIEVVKPDVIVHGDDWTGPEYLAQLGVTEDWLEERGIELAYFPYTPGVSTTALLEEKCRMKTAAN